MLRISVDVNPEAPNLNEITAAIRLLQGFITGKRDYPAVPDVLAIEDNPDAGLDPNEVFGEAAGALTNGPSADAAFGQPAGFTPPPAAAPIQTQAATSTPAGTNPNLDSEGLPWDGRIHAETKTRLKGDDTWKLKRGIEPATVEHVKAELRALMAVPGAASFTPPAPPAAPVQAPPPPPAPPAPAPSASPSVAAVSATAPTPNANGCAAPAAAVTTFVQLVGKWAPLLNTGRITQDEVRQACVTYGVPDLPLLSARPDLVPMVDAHLSSVLASKD